MSLQPIQRFDAGRRLVRVAAPLILVVFGSDAFALGLGEPNVATVLGQPLQMTVPLVMEPGLELTQECVRLIPGRELGEPIPSLNTARITIDTQGRQLKIESLQPVSEPTLRVVIEVGCSQHVRREFALLLDPPSMTTSLSSADAAGSGLARRTESSIGLGMAQISAVLGQRLSLKVPVVGTEAGSLSADCVHLADPISSEGAPVLRQADIRVLPRDTGALIEVETPGPVTEPAVRLALDVGCREPLRREFAILLGLPALAASNAGSTAAAEQPQPPQPVAKPTPKRVAKAPRVVTAVPVAPAAAPDAGAPVSTAGKPAEARGVKAGSDRLVLGSPEDLVRPPAAGVAKQDPTANAELLKRLDTMALRIQELEVQLNASRQREQDLERRAWEARQQWTWSMVVLGSLLVAGAVVLAWRQRRPPAQPAWEPVVSRAGPVARVKPAPAIHASTRATSREAPEIGGRATMPPAPNTTGGASTEPSLSDGRHTQITVTELHDTVQVIKELYASVLERNSSSNTSSGRPQQPLELDLRAPTGLGPPTVPAARTTDGQKTVQAAQGRAEERSLGDRFTELPTEVGLDLDLSSVVKPAAPDNTPLIDTLEQQADDRLPVQARQRTDAAALAEPTPGEPAAGGSPAADAATAPAALEAERPAAFAPHKGHGAGEFADENLTQTPTEVSIDIDVGATTDFVTTVGWPALRASTPQRPEAGRPRNTAAALEPIDLQLDLNQPELNSKKREKRSA